MTKKIRSLPPGTQRKMEYLEYWNSLSKEEQKWISQFYHEFYNDGVSFTEPEKRILQTKEMQKEARRNHNSMKRDAYEVAEKSGGLDYLYDERRRFAESEADFEYLEVFDSQGYEAAVQFLVDETIPDLDNMSLDLNIVLIRFYLKMEELRRHRNRQVRQDREERKTDEKE